MTPSGRAADPPWPGRWVADALGATLDPGGAGPTSPVDAVGIRDLVGLALRRNPRRAHLPVSRVLGKHVPADPRLVRAAGLVLGHRVGRLLDGAGATPDLPAGALAGGPAAAAARDVAVRIPPPRVPSVVLGFVENGTALGHLVAEALDADHLVTSTRRSVPGATPLGTFLEPHSHAPRHLLVPDEPERWSPELAMVLVDDELSTGHTVAESLRLLHRTHPRPHYVVAALVDLRDGDDDVIERAARELGVRVDVVALARGRLRVPADAVERSARLAAVHIARPALAATARHRPADRPVELLRLPLDGAPESARHGVDRLGRAALEAVLPAAVRHLRDALGPRPGPVLVLGTEELHHLPVRLAEGLADSGHDVSVAATTRSPAVAVDVEGYAIRSALTFPAHDTATGERYAYGLGHPGSPRFETVVVVVDDDARTPALRRAGGLLDRLGRLVPRVVEAAVATRRPTARPPAVRGPAFGTFAPDEVSWLVSDLSSIALEVPRDERERAMAAGRHYSETLPEEHPPSADHVALFHHALDRSAAPVAGLVGRVTDGVLARGAPAPVLVSLARAGTPVGVLMRRWALRVRGVELPHYTMSVVRGRGPDPAALAALLTVHDPASLVFVDGWTGKGAITDELTTTVTRPTVVVLADPAHTATLYGTRDDVLIPSACLTATVCGLVSRTVRRPDLHGPAAYDGAKFYPALGDADRTATFLDAVTSWFPDPAPRPPVDTAAGTTGLTDTTDPPDHRGRAYVTALARELGIDDEHRVKPGLGETTRVLLRRVPQAVLVAPDAGEDADHLRTLCRRHDVPVAELPRSAGGVACPYRSVGVIGR